jgi:hypothetical protein
MAQNGDQYAYRRGDAQLIPVLARGGTLEEAATAAGLSERTVSRRLSDPRFRVEVLRSRGELFAHALGKLASQAEASVMALAAIRDDVSAPWSVRRAAARDILTIGQALSEALDIELRLGEVEQTLAELEQMAR